MRILIVDDDSSRMGSLARQVSLRGHEVACCSCAQAALAHVMHRALAEDRRVAGILAGVWAEGLEAVGLLEDLRRHGQSTPLLLVGGPISMELALRAKKARCLGTLHGLDDHAHLDLALDLLRTGRSHASLPITVRRPTTGTFRRTRSAAEVAARVESTAALRRESGASWTLDAQVAAPQPESDDLFGEFDRFDPVPEVSDPARRGSSLSISAMHRRRRSTGGTERVAADDARRTAAQQANGRESQETAALQPITTRASAQPTTTTRVRRSVTGSFVQTVPLQSAAQPDPAPAAAPPPVEPTISFPMISSTRPATDAQ